MSKLLWDIWEITDFFAIKISIFWLGFGFVQNFVCTCFDLLLFEAVSVIFWNKSGSKVSVCVIFVLQHFLNFDYFLKVLSTGFSEHTYFLCLLFSHP